MQVKRSIEQVEPQLFQELVTPIKRQKSNYELEVFLEFFPFTLSEPFTTTETPIIADYNNIQEITFNKYQQPDDKLDVVSVETLEFSEVDNSEYEADISSSSSDEYSDSSVEESDSYASEESEFEIVVKKKKRCGAMWSPECRRARRCICAEKIDYYDDYDE